MKTIAIVPSAGTGKRLKRPHKPFININSKPVLYHTLSALNKSRHINKIVLVVSGESLVRAKRLVEKNGFRKVKRVIIGGAERRDSVCEGLKCLDADTDLVLIHDGARPCLEGKIITAAVKAAAGYGAACVCVPVKPTVKVVKKGYIQKSPARDTLWEAQTPQVFKKDIILKAYKKGIKVRAATDDAKLVEEAGYKIRVVMGSYRNIKITTEEDLLLARELLRSR